MRGWAVTLARPTKLLMSCYHSSRPNPHQANKAVSSFLTADIIRLEYCKDWHECCASISAPHALQCACLRCYTLCLRFGTWHHYCRWYAFRYTGEFFLSFANLTSFWLKKKRHLSDYLLIILQSHITSCKPCFHFKTRAVWKASGEDLTREHILACVGVSEVKLCYNSTNAWIHTPTYLFANNVTKMVNIT